LASFVEYVEVEVQRIQPNSADLVLVGGDGVDGNGYAGPFRVYAGKRSSNRLPEAKTGAPIRVRCTIASKQ
jgi:hypothetical protein